MKQYRPVLLSMFPSRWGKQQVWCSKFCPLGRFPYTTVLQGHSFVAVQFQVRECCVEPFVNQACVFPSLVNWSWRPSHRATGATGKGGGNLAGLGAMGIWATCLCNLCMPAGPVHPWSCIFCYPLMTEYCCTHPILWLGESDNIQLIMDSSHGNLVICGQVLSQSQKHFLKRKTVICRWYNFPPKS